MGWVMIGVVAVMLLVGVFVAVRFLLPDMMHRSLMKTLATSGTLAPARVVSVGETGRRYASNPVVRFELEVLPEQGTPFAATVEQAVPMIALPQVQPGAQVRVRFDPADRRRVALVDR